MPKLISRNPTTGAIVAEIDEASDADLERCLDAAHRVSHGWRETSFSTRAAILTRAAEILERDRESYARLMSLEMGKTLVAARAEVEKCAGCCRYYALHGAEMIAPALLHQDGQATTTLRYEPLGVVLAVMPWNFPFWQVIRFAAPALAAGNVGLLKHAANVPRCAMALQELFHLAGAPAGVFQTLLIGSARVGRVIADERVHAVTLTGSEGAGRSVAATAGANLKKTVLELGGSDPFVVLSSADVARAAEVATTARCINNGQSCIAAKRFIIVDAVYEQFLGHFLQHMRALRVGDPLDALTAIGPLATAAIRDEVDTLVRQSVAAGAQIALGGAPLANDGFFYPPTVLVDVPHHAAAAVEEIFGPVAAVFRVTSTAEAIALANATRFGLGASIWTQDRDEAAACVAGIEAGAVFVNGMVASDSRFPFGGIKASGYGRELGPWGLREFMNLKTVRQFA